MQRSTLGARARGTTGSRLVAQLPRPCCQPPRTAATAFRSRHATCLSFTAVSCFLTF